MAKKYTQILFTSFLAFVHYQFTLFSPLVSQIEYKQCIEFTKKQTKSKQAERDYKTQASDKLSVVGQLEPSIKSDIDDTCH